MFIYNNMKISAEELNILASLIANKLAQNLTKSELLDLKCFLQQVCNDLGFILSMKTFDAIEKKLDKNKSK